MDHRTSAWPIPSDRFGSPGVILMSSDRDRLLILSSIPVFTEGLVWAAGLSNRECWVMSDEIAPPSWDRLPHVLGVEPMSRQELEAVDESLLESVIRACAVREIGIVVAADTRSNRLVHRLVDRLPPTVEPFPMCSEGLFERLYDKGSFAELLVDLEIPRPKTAIVSSEAEVRAIELSPPYILKPCQGESGDGIITVASTQELHAEVTRRARIGDVPLVVQELIPGEDIDLSVLADHGRCIAWTIQQNEGTGQKRFVLNDQVLALGKRIIEGTGYHGVAHFDMRIDHRNGEILVIEANPRFWGTLSYSVWSGVNFLDLGIRMMRGEDLTSVFREVECVCPYLGVTRGSIVRDLLGGWPVPKNLSAPQKRAWRFHHRRGSGASRASALAWIARVNRPHRSLPMSSARAAVGRWLLR